MNRRDFLIKNGSFLALINLVGCAGLKEEIFRPSLTPSDKEFAVFWHGTRPGHEILLPQSPSNILFIDPHTLKYESINIPVTTHSIVQDGDRVNKLYLVSKWSREVALFDRDQNKVTKILVRPDTTRVYGHGVWDPKRKGLWFTEHDLKDLKGYLVFCNQQMVVENRIETGGSMPHEVQLAANGNFIIANSQGVGHKGAMPNMSFIDSTTLKVTNIIDIPELKKIGVITHLVQSKTDNRIFTGGQSLGTDKSVMVTIDNEGKPTVLPIHENPHYIGESFSMVHDAKKDDLLWVTPASGALFRWNLNDSKLVSVDLAKSYRNIHEYEDQLYLTCKNDNSLHRQKKEIEKLLSITPPAAGTWGVHMHTLKKAV